MIVMDAAELDWSYILQFWDPNQHFGERMTENLDQTLHTDTAKTVRPAASPWVLLVYYRAVMGGGGRIATEHPVELIRPR